ncbi:response regulator [Elizabethkingia meningoseptica]|uniref:response regulator n=1 Tax=Elizabethkingia meningoseptica TaxID=238 RepID=UPI0023B1A421|nr:response regulator [Elizabethkingia meningoseptica]MDE5467962.1 response regulator [Elizabethkingia meningoseptica]MDE5474881.1 response regulator [Elizabethkingia meningoseptica]MDE5478314.1 response regulator [Elizabethkingia meningoseptica]MDE5486713.1 response regulator [Elizabethkingia meningoseptica]MDE5501694.1 response regulator [Elizabethkingia meningoseptica]
METNNQNLKFFIVDDDKFCATVYEQYLKNNHYEDITSFNNGEECLDELHQKPDIIFLDHNMEELNGFEVLKKIKRYNPNIYVIMVSAQENIDTAVNALKYGAFDYLMKDANVCEKMTQTIKKILKIKEEMSQNKLKNFRKFFSILF